MSLLLFGATGNVGKHVVSAALKKLDQQKKVVCFVRNPSKIPADQRDRVNIIEGDYTDEQAVKKADIDTKPSSIIITTAPTRIPLTPFNVIVAPRIIDALQQDNRLNECSIIYLGDSFSNIPGQPQGWLWSIFAQIISRIFGITAEVADNAATLEYFYSTPPELTFLVLL